jgi:hypothetical protein
MFSFQPVLQQFCCIHIRRVITHGVPIDRYPTEHIIFMR